jgi:hypothetical protein
MTIQYNPTLTGLAPNVLDGTGAFSPILDPTKFYFFFDDFTSCVKTTTNGGVFFTGGNNISWSGGFTGTGALAKLVNPPDSGCIGSALLTSGNANTNYAQILNSLLVTATSQTPMMCRLDDKIFDIKIRAKILSTASIGASFQLTDFGSNSFSIRYDTSIPDSGWVATKTIGGVGQPKVTITGAPLDTNYHTFRMRATTAGTILFSVDGGTEVSQTFGATTTLTLLINVSSYTSAAKSMAIDYVWGWVRLAR